MLSLLKSKIWPSSLWFYPKSQSYETIFTRLRISCHHPVTIVILLILIEYHVLGEVLRMTYLDPIISLIPSSRLPWSQSKFYLAKFWFNFTVMKFKVYLLKELKKLADFSERRLVFITISTWFFVSSFVLIGTRRRHRTRRWHIRVHSYSYFDPSKLTSDKTSIVCKRFSNRRFNRISTETHYSRPSFVTIHVTKFSIMDPPIVRSLCDYNFTSTSKLFS